MGVHRRFKYTAICLPYEYADDKLQYKYTVDRLRMNVPDIFCRAHVDLPYAAASARCASPPHAQVCP